MDSTTVAFAAAAAAAAAETKLPPVRAARGTSGYNDTRSEPRRSPGIRAQVGGIV